jgi:hypothetical protein
MSLLLLLSAGRLIAPDTRRSKHADQRAVALAANRPAQESARRRRRPAVRRPIGGNLASREAGTVRGGVPRWKVTVGGDTVSTTGSIIAAGFAGLSLVTWLIILLIVIVVVAIFSRRRI